MMVANQLFGFLQSAFKHSFLLSFFLCILNSGQTGIFPGQSKGLPQKVCILNFDQRGQNALPICTHPSEVQKCQLHHTVPSTFFKVFQIDRQNFCLIDLISMSLIFAKIMPSFFQMFISHLYFFFSWLDILSHCSKFFYWNVYFFLRTAALEFLYNMDISSLLLLL